MLMICKQCDFILHLHWKRRICTIFYKLDLKLWFLTRTDHQSLTVDDTSGKDTFHIDYQSAKKTVVELGNFAIPFEAQIALSTAEILLSRLEVPLSQPFF